MSTRKLQVMGSLGTGSGSGSSITIDTTLTQAGKAADAKATGDKFSGLETQINNIDALVGDTSVANQISDAIDDYYTKTETDTFLEEKINKQDYLGPVIMEGNPVTYDNGVEGFDIRVETNFSPKQAGSGTPYPAGGGKNLLNHDMWQYVGVHNGTGVFENNGVTLTALEDDCYTVDGIGFEDVNAYLAKIPVTPGESITLSWEADRNYSAPVYIFPNADILGVVQCNNNENRPLVYTATEGVSFVTIRFTAVKAGDVISYRNIMVNKGTEALPFEPYENIRPITGYDALDLNHARKNLLNPSAIMGSQDGLTFSLNPDGGITINGTATASGSRLVSTCDLPNGGSVFSMRNNAARVGNATVFCEGTSVDINYGLAEASDIIDKSGPVKVITWWESGAAFNNFVVYLMVEAGTTPSPFAPYHGNTYTVQIGQTVYGGRMDWLTGKLTADCAYVALTGNESLWREESVNNSGNARFTIMDVVPGIVVAGEANINLVCSHYRVAYNPITDNDINACICGFSNNPNVFVRDDAHESAEAYKAWLAAQHAAGTPVQIAYKLATPVEIQLEPIQIQSLQGTNTIYGDGDSHYVIFNSAGSGKVAQGLTIQANGTDLGTYDGSEEKVFNITPSNIGALGNSGVQVLDKGLLIIRSDKEDGNAASLATNVEACYYQFFPDGENIKNYLGMHENYTEFMQPLVVASGGTGANNPAQARENLGITPANIGAVTTEQYSSLSSLVGDTAVSTQISNAISNITPENIGALPLTGGTLSGSISVNGGGAGGWASLHTCRTLDGVLHEANVYVDSGGASISYTKNGEWTNSLALRDNGIETYRPLLVNSGGTGATDAATARANLGITPENIGAATTAQFNNLSSLVGDTTVSTQISNYAPSKTGSGASGTWNINVTGYSYATTKMYIDNSSNQSDCLQYIQTSSQTPGNDLPSSEWWHVLKMNHGVGDTYYKRLLAFDFHSNTIKTNWATFDGTLKGWDTLITSGNYTDYTLRYNKYEQGDVVSGANSTSMWLVYSDNGVNYNQMDLWKDRTSFTKPVDINSGGTGATSKSGARTNLGITSGTTLPSSASAGDIFFLYS